MGAAATPAHALVVMREKGTALVAETEVIEDDLYITGETVEIRGTVNGDVFAAGGSVRMSGNVTGDLIVGAGEVRVSGTVGDDLWIGGGSVNIIKAQIGDGVVVGAGSVTIDSDSSIGGSLLAGAGMLDVSAPIGRNLMAGAGQVRLDSAVGKEMRVGTESLELGTRARIGEDLTYMSESELTLSEGATVAGETKRLDSKYPNRVEKEKAAGFAYATHLGLNFFSYLGALVVGLVLLWLMQKPTLAIAGKIQNNLLSVIGWGLLVFVLSGPAIIMLMVTGIGIPLALIAAALILIDFYLAKIFASMALGLAMQKKFGWKKMQVGWALVLGLTVYYVLRIIPLVGMFVRLIAFLAGIGAVALYLKSAKK